MRGYIALAWAQSAADAGARALDRLRRLEGWAPAAQGAGWLVLTPQDGATPVHRLAYGHGAVVGDLFRRDDSTPVPADALDNMPSGSPVEVARVLMRAFWGRYVALIAGPYPDEFSMFRDPTGALDCITWRIGGLTIVASHLPGGLLEALSPALGMNWERIGELLADPVGCGGALAVDGLKAVTPGALRTPAGDTQLWRPGDIARRPIERLDRARSDLVRQVDTCVPAYAGSGQPFLAEVSGGLDSAIVAAAIRRARDTSAALWLNYHVDDPWGDERPYARSVAEALEFRLTEADMPIGLLDPDDFGPALDAPRPSFYGLDQAYDRDVAERALAAGAGRILTGQGGDAIFYQRSTDLIAVDLVQAQGLAAFRSPLVPSLARWRRTSVWQVMQVMWRARRLARAPAAVLGGAATGPRSPHPWLEDLEDVAPAKRLQIESLVACSIYYGACRRAQAVDLVHPLLSQPVVEHCLSVPAEHLTMGVRDRALAREAFAGRLPPSVLARRSKGDLTTTYCRMVAASLPLLRPHLLEGRLAAQGLLDRERLEAVMDPDHLVEAGGHAEIAYATALEAWVRAWETRIADLRASRPTPAEGCAKAS